MLTSQRVDITHRRRRAPIALAIAAVLLAPLLPGAGASAAQAHVSDEARIALTTAWSGHEFVAGERVQVTGAARPASAVHRVVLQRRTPDGWTRVAAVSPGTARYSFRLPTGWYGQFTYRVVASGRDGAGSTVSATRRIRVVPAYDPRGSAHAHQLVAEPVARWEPCRVIGYRLNTAQADPGARRDIRGALRRVYQATGLRFVYRGTTGIIPQDFVNAYPDDTDLVIAWARPSQSRLLSRNGGSPLGVGGAAWALGFRNADGSAASRIDSGYVVLDSTQQDRLRAGFGRGVTRGELLMHEIGHAVGLQHVDDRRQLMYPLMQPGPARWGAGDLAGMAKVGAHRGCLS